MSYKCSKCGIRDVANEGDVCEICAITQDPYASSSSNSNRPRRVILSDTSNTQENTYIPKNTHQRKVIINDNVPKESSYVEPVVHDTVPAQVKPSTPSIIPKPKTTSITSLNPQSVTVNQGATSGIVKNISFSDDKISILRKLCRTIFSGIPFTLDNDVTSFQVFPDFSGTTLNASGHTSDQVVVYGRITKGAISENNDVTVYGRRNRQNVIIADKIVNSATGAIIKPERKIPSVIIWVIFFLIFATFAPYIMAAPADGILTLIVLIICLTNLPLVFKAIAFIGRIMWSLIDRSIGR